MGFSKAKVVGFITIILILFLLISFALKIVSFNKSKQEDDQSLVYKESLIDASLNSNYLEYIPLGEDYVEDGLSASSDGKDLSDKVIVSYFNNNTQVMSIDTNAVNNYLVKYTVVSSKEKKDIYKTVIVVDNKKPSIKFPKNTTIKVSDVASFDLEKDVVVSDDSAKVDFTYDDTLEAKEGSYIITYKATDLSGNKTTKKRLIKVIN